MKRRSAFSRSISEIVVRLILLFMCYVLYQSTRDGAFHTDIIGDTFGCKYDPCIIKENYGGLRNRFSRVIEAIANGERQRIIIDGPCVSGCARVADERRTDVCTTHEAIFGVHKGYELIPLRNILLDKPLDEISRRVDQTLSKEFLTLVQARGGLPENGDPVWFSAEEVKHFIPFCNETNLEAKSNQLMHLSTQVPVPTRDPCKTAAK